MIRGMFVSRASFAGAITFSIFVSRALSEFVSNPIVEIMINPIVVFILFLIAGVIITYPQLHGVRALIIAPLLVTTIIFFTYVYYIL